MDSPGGDGHAGCKATRGATAATMEPRTESQDMAAAADLIAALSRTGAPDQGDVQQQQAPVTVAPQPPAASAPRPPPWQGVLPAPDARVEVAGAPARPATGAAAATAAVGAPAPAVRERSPYTRRGSHVPLGDRPPPKPASSVKFSRRNAPYVCQVLALSCIHRLDCCRLTDPCLLELTNGGQLMYNLCFVSLAIPIRRQHSCQYARPVYVS